MRTIRKTGDPVKEAVARPENAPSNRSVSMDLYGFEDGPVKMKPELMLEALLLGRGLAKAGTSAAKNILKKGKTKAQRVINDLLNESTRQVGENAAQNSMLELLGFE